MKNIFLLKVYGCMQFFALILASIFILLYKRAMPLETAQNL